MPQTEEMPVVEAVFSLKPCFVGGMNAHNCISASVVERPFIFSKDKAKQSLQVLSQRTSLPIMVGNAMAPIRINPSMN